MFVVNVLALIFLLNLILFCSIFFFVTRETPVIIKRAARN